MTRVVVELPEADDLGEILLDLAVPHEDINELLALRYRMTSDPGLRRQLDADVRALVRNMGQVDRAGKLSWMSGESGAVGRYFPVYVFVAALPYVRAYHRERSVPDDVSRRTLADLGRNMAVHRRRRGTGGLLIPGWIGLHFRGEIYQLGRLQFERARLGSRMGEAVRAAGLPLGPEDPCLNLHIPDFLGSLAPAACERSLARAREFFARHFPEERYRVATCHSWLLDPQVAAYLPKDSNIVRFQNRFRTAYEERQVRDGGPVGFVFGDPELPAEGLPRRTTLERAIGDHLRAGRHWYGGHGWFEI
ncbi:acyltransferase domain-containing protein [Streptomyces sp. NBC_01142]|uniref:acyltransferase domain-containing protein n=1 Tax=Streptomyces sp. NBC_01142 TaxID=2975865 RepID=UPI002252A05B|nr:acyltransferase domain-containing protein [Streptomyces sp. NBC_01142]MCX4822331.1 acyltransferase domain-containing protein [Streptomyces sp. NBC_01142]